MADPRRRLEENAPGPWFVDASCIDCDACRQIAPDVFTEGNEQALVARQPGGDHRVDAFRALVACPVGAIGTEGSGPVPAHLFPQPLEDGVSYCGYNSEASYGANSFFAERREGNLLIDSPRWAKLLVRELEKRGGVSDILLTHQDVADAERYRDHFKARVWIHEADRRAAPFATHLLEGEERREVRPGLLAIPVPGHTRGSVVYLLEEKFLFTGDSLYWSRGRRALTASRSYCWYSWEKQIGSLARLAQYDFEWVLAGHGDRIRLPRHQARASLLALTRQFSRA